jgi:hypothetical protein
MTPRPADAGNRYVGSANGVPVPDLCAARTLLVEDHERLRVPRGITGQLRQSIRLATR